VNLTTRSYERAVSRLAKQSPDLGRAVSKWGRPPFWTHPAGFPGIVLAILAQQVSLESAQAAFSKLEKLAGPAKPDVFIALDDNALRAVGFSRQKASYVREIAHATLEGQLNIEALDTMTDDEARDVLVQRRGVGPWTADTYLLFSLRRADAWPTRDLALAKAIQELRKLRSMPSWEKVDAIAETWKPWRAVAARILWHHYLSHRGRSASA
jgi:DNA-3-methyladenine glycosylase II